MKKIIKDWALSKDVTALVLRLVFGLSLFYGHGLGKLQAVFSGKPVQFMDPIGFGEEFTFYLAVFAEGICSLLVVIGLFTRLSVIPPLLTMLVIVLMVHLGQGFDRLEMPLLYLAGFLAIFFTGSGRFSIDHLLGRK